MLFTLPRFCALRKPALRCATVRFAFGEATAFVAFVALLAKQVAHRRERSASKPSAPNGYQKTKFFERDEGSKAKAKVPLCEIYAKACQKTFGFLNLHF